ncbi:MAG TPA: efflux transporter outer membrane subunit [Gemmataceae bacterium]|nr:efflux transporter outer membrane subunit [Gemmataceae bacterium]
MAHLPILRSDRARRAAALAALALLAGGCTTLDQWVCNGFKVGPNYRQQPAPVAAQWIDADDERVAAAPPDDAWWAVFNDPALDSLIETAYKQNLDLKTAATRVLQARAQRNIAAGNLLPQTQEAVGAYAHAQLSKNGGLFGPGGVAGPPAAAAALTPTTFDVWASGFNATWELDFWGRIRRNIESSKAQLAASVDDYRNSLVTLTADVATQYVQIRTFQQRIAYARQNAELQRKSLGIVRDRKDLGRADALDVAQAQSLLAQTEASIPPLEIGLRQANDQLCILLGLPPRELVSCLPEAPVPSAPPQVAVGLPAELLLRRPDVRAAERQAAAQCAQIGVAEADFYPRIAATGFLGYTANDIRQLFAEDSLTGVIAPNFQWKILNYGRILNNVRSQDARFQELTLDYQRSVLSAAREVEDALAGFLQYQAQARSLQTSVEAAQTSVDKVLIQWQAGAADFNRVFTTQSQLVTAQDQLAVAQGNIALSLISVYRALGGGWQTLEKSGAETCAKPEPTAIGDLLEGVPRSEQWVPAAPAAPTPKP